MLKLLLGHQLGQLVITFGDTLLVSGVDDENDAVRAVVVILPVGSDSLLTANVPHVQLKAVLGLQLLVRIARENVAVMQ